MSRGRSHAEVLSMRRKGTLPPFLKWTGGFPRKVDEVVFQYPLVTFHDWRAGMENELLAAWLAMVRDQPDLEPSRCVCCGRCTKNKKFCYSPYSTQSVDSQCGHPPYTC